MALAAASFYGRPNNANARLLFRASLLHLPIFMAAFLLHRRPNTGELDRAGLLSLEARRLGFGAPLRRADEPHGAPACVAAALAAGLG
jgi:protoheme IX farnesyltransferase